MPRVAPVVHSFHPARFGQGLIAQCGPSGTDPLRRALLLVPLLGHAIQGANLLSQAPVPEHHIGGQQDVQMGVAGLPVEADVDCHAIGFGQPASEVLGQPGLLVSGESTRQGRVNPTRHHGVLPSAVGLHPIPEGLPFDLRGSSRQDQGEGRHMLLVAVVRHEPRPEVRHPGGRAVGTGRHRGAAHCPPHDGHGQVEQGWSIHGHITPPGRPHAAGLSWVSGG